MVLFFCSNGRRSCSQFTCSFDLDAFEVHRLGGLNFCLERVLLRTAARAQDEQAQGALRRLSRSTSEVMLFMVVGRLLEFLKVVCSIGQLPGFGVYMFNGMSTFGGQFCSFPTPLIFLRDEGGLGMPSVSSGILF